MNDVTALVVGAPTRLERPPVDVAWQAVNSLDGVRAAAERVVTPLVWLLDAAAVPDARTLVELLAEPSVPAVSLAVDEEGCPHDRWIGSFVDDDVEAVVAQAHRHRAPLRFCPVVSLLVPRELVLAERAPDVSRFGPYADLEWTARLFGTSGASLVSTSKVRMPDAPLPVAPRALVRLVRGERFRRFDAARQVRLGLRPSRLQQAN